MFVLDILGQGASSTNLIRRIDAATGIITTVAGGGTNVPGTGPATNMNINFVSDLVVSDAGKLFLASSARVLMVDLATGQLTPFAGDGIAGYSGDGGPALNARFYGGDNSLTLAPGGGLLISDSGNARIRYVVPDSITLTNDSGQTAFYLPWVSALSNLTIVGNPNLTVVNAGSLTNVGGSLTISSNTSADTINVGMLVTVSGELDISGNISAGELDLPALISAGELTITDNTSADAINVGSLTTVSGDLTIASNAPNANVNLNSLTNYGCGSNEVTITLDGGTFAVTNGLTLCTNATLAGSSTLDGSITNNGTIEPGASPGRLNITGRLVLANSSTLRLEIGGYTPGSQFDFLSVTGNVTLGGTLAVSLINNFPSVMTNGASFTLLTAGSPLAGAFANVASGSSLTTTDGYARFTVLYAGETTVRLTGLVIVDTDNDGLPDWWEDQFSLNKANPADAALDLDGDGSSNANEFRAGTVPTNAASVFRIVSIQRESNSMHLTWSTVGGKSYFVQTNGILSNNFADLSQLINVSDAGESTTNLLDAGAATNAAVRYYRVRLGP